MKKHRVATTISEKHWELLKRNAEKFETQQKALELALECMESNSKQRLMLTEEEKFWTHAASDKTACIVQKDFLKMLIENSDIEFHKEYVTRNKPIEYTIEHYIQKPLKECSLKEIVDGLTIVFRISHLFDTIDYKDNGDYYLLMVTHSLGLNSSKLNLLTFESVFNTYGVKVWSMISEKTIFMRIFKN
jgi:hypothetical protein